MSTFRVLCLPYCLKRLDDGRYVALNRRYKPLGFTTQATVQYEAYPIALRLAMTRQRAAALSWKGSDDVAMIYLYADSGVPTDRAADMQAYLTRLAQLAAYTVKEESMRDGLTAHACEVCHEVTVRWVLWQNARAAQRYFCDNECLATWIARGYEQVRRETVLECTP